MRILWVCQLLLVGEFLLVPYVHAAHGDNMLCEGCGTVMEHVYHDVVKYSEEVGKSIDMTQGETLTVDFSDRVKKICDQDEFLSHYNRNVRSACWEMCHKFPNVLSNVFGGDEPTERAVYKITYKACVDVLDYCDKIDGSYTDKLFRSKSSQASLSSVKCNRCRTVVSDMVNVVERKSSWDFFRTKEHIYSVLDSICNGIVYRFPEKLMNPLSEMCSDIIESHEHEIAKILIEKIDQAEKLICGSEMTSLCSEDEFKKNRFAWDSPFHRKPLTEMQLDPFEDEEAKTQENADETAEVTESENLPADDGLDKEDVIEL